MNFLVEVYEPAIDPGGYEDVFEVDADCEYHAKEKALTKAEERWPKNKGLATGRIVTKRAFEFAKACKIN
jgi:hypothetical protein